MYSRIMTSIIRGIDSVPVSVETDVSNGMPTFEMVGFLSSEVKESKERVRAAIRNVGYVLPVQRITVNFSPANIRKSGSAFDLPCAVTILAAMGVIPSDMFDQILMLGELGLDGRIMSVSGVLPAVIMAREMGLSFCFVPFENRKEAGLVPDVNIIPVETLQDVIEYLKTGTLTADTETHLLQKETTYITGLMEGNKEEAIYEHDFSEIRGQKIMRRACEIAAAGRHNLLMVGPPGAGKSLIAKCIPSILPPMSQQEMVEVSKIYSVCGLYGQRETLMKQRPFRDPHHTITEPGLTGGGTFPKPGEISLAHCGVLFLDELPEFQRSTLEVLRQPMEDHQVHIVRQQGSVTFPSDFMLVAAMNPCPCGLYPSKKCSCTPHKVRSYIGRISQPLLDRIDICIDAPALKYKDLMNAEVGEDSGTIRQRVIRVQEIQRKRFHGTEIRCNGEIPGKDMELYCHLDKKEEALMSRHFEQLGLTARSFHKLLRVARTIADMAGEEQIRKEHLLEAEMYRGLELDYWKEV